VDIVKKLKLLHKRGVKNAIIEPVWRGKKVVVQYYHWNRIASEHDALLDSFGWPKDLRGTYPDWGGRRPEQLNVITRLVVTKNKTIPVAYGVRTKAVMPHNALLTRNLLMGHGFTTGTGWYRCVSTQDAVTGSLDVSVMHRTSNVLQLPIPKRWRIIEL
jgi:hypothetical protein